MVLSLGKRRILSRLFFFFFCLLFTRKKVRFWADVCVNRSGIYFFYSRKRKKVTVLTFPVEISEEATHRAEHNSYRWWLFSNVFKKYPVIYRKYLSGQAVNRCHSAKYLVGIKEGGRGGGCWVLRTFHGHQKVELTHHERSDKRL